MWNEQNDQLQKTYEFKDFAEAFAYMTEAAFHIEKANHHPEWKNVYNRLDVVLTTHDAGNTVTDKDRDLAKVLDRLYAKYTG